MAKRWQPDVLLIALVLCLDLGSALAPVSSRYLGQTVAMVAALCVVGIAICLARSAAAEPAHESPRWLLGLLLIGWLANLAHLATGRLDAHLSWVQIGVLASGAGALLYCLRHPPSPLLLCAGALVFGSALRLASFGPVPIDPRDGDMLPLVQGALSRFTSGQSPYTLYHFPWPLPLVYPPLTWLVYLPAHLLGVDLRVINLGLELLIFACLFHLAGGLRTVVLLWAFVFVNGSMVHWSLHVTHTVFWALFCVVLVLLWSGRLVLLAIATGLCLATSPLSLILVFFCFLHVLAQNFRRPLYLLSLCALALSVAALCYLPFFLWDREAFLLGLVKWHNQKEHIAYEFWKLHNGGAQIGFAGLFDWLGLDGLLKPLQALLVLGVAGLYVRKGVQRDHLPLALTVAYALFLVVNPLLRGHYYGVVLVSSALALSCRK